jgi:hypothetical protein
MIAAPLYLHKQRSMTIKIVHTPVFAFNKFLETFYFSNTTASGEAPSFASSSPITSTIFGGPHK